MGYSRKIQTGRWGDACVCVCVCVCVCEGGGGGGGGGVEEGVKYILLKKKQDFLGLASYFTSLF